MEVKLDIAWSLGREQASPTGTTLLPLLRAIDEHGSLSRAAKSLDVSYRKAWNLVNRWSEQLGHSLVVMERGRGATLSALGAKLIWVEDHARNQTASLLNEIEKEIADALTAVQSGHDAKDLTIFASHCLTHQVLKEAARNSGIEMTIKNAGSARALSALADQKCLAAGFHLPEGELRNELVSRYRRDIEPEAYTLVHALTRKQGLIVAHGNPKKINNIEDLTKSSVVFVNRQSNSGTRLLFDSILRSRGVNASHIRGYDVEEFTHSAVSALIASGSVDAGIGTQASASQLGLDFISLANESYFYAIANDKVETKLVQQFIECLSNKAFRESANNLTGYDADDSGKLIPAASILDL